MSNPVPFWSRSNTTYFPYYFFYLFIRSAAQHSSAEHTLWGKIKHNKIENTHPEDSIPFHQDVPGEGRGWGTTTFLSPVLPPPCCPRFGVTGQSRSLSVSSSVKLKYNEEPLSRDNTRTSADHHSTTRPAPHRCGHESHLPQPNDRVISQHFSPSTALILRIYPYSRFFTAPNAHSKSRLTFLVTAHPELLRGRTCFLHYLLDNTWLTLPSSAVF